MTWYGITQVQFG